MNEKQRLDKILSYLSEKNYTPTKLLLEKTQMKPSTFHKDLKYLSDLNLIKRVYGQVIKVKQVESFTKNHSTDIQVKNHIALKACKHVKEGDLLFIDAGTTTNVMFTILNHTFSNLHIVTNSIGFINNLPDIQNKITIIPGELDLTKKRIIGQDSLEYIKQFNFDNVFLSTYGAKDGNFSLTTDKDLSLKRYLVKNFENSYVIYNKNKKNIHGQYIFANNGSAKLITD